MTDHHDQLSVAPDPAQAEELRRRLHARMARVPHDRHERPTVDLEVVPAEHDDAVDRDHHHGRRALVLVLAAAAVLAIVAGAVALLRIDEDADGPITTDPPATTTTVPSLGGIPDGAVWYDDAGLHHGDVVEPTPFELNERDEIVSVLALVRDGALYDEPRTGDLWFHPWGGEPRVVGHDTETGPGGDAEGVVAAWFEDTDLVVYDTVRGVEISRTPETPVLAAPFRQYVGGYEHVVGNGFMHVSSEEVVWRSGAGVHRLDVASGRSSLVWEGSPFAELRLEDRQDGTRVWGDYGTGTLSVEVEGRGRIPLPDLEPMGRLSRDGRFVLSAVDTDGAHGAAFVQLRTGETWPVVGQHWNAWISWSYGDIAVLRVEWESGSGPAPGLFACDAEARECTQLQSGGSFVLPSS